MKRTSVLAFALVPAVLAAQTPAKRRIVAGDIYRIKEVGSAVI